MNRTERARIAQETLEIVKQGSYTASAGVPVSIGPLVTSCVRATVFYPAGETEALCIGRRGLRPLSAPAAVEVRNETTLSAIFRLARHGSVAALNFASAKNAGGGFLGGSQAQEESLARSSALYESLQHAPQFYQLHRSGASALYSDSMILSPGCPVFRDDDGALLDEPVLATFITSPAPNAGAIAANSPGQVQLIEPTLRRRAEQVLALASHAGARNLVLGAWGCGVFHNDPATVAAAFADLLSADSSWGHHFERVAFAVYDSSASQATFRAFRDALITEPSS
jgi:uncharacterized protein (TIGR02452 family)